MPRRHRGIRHPTQYDIFMKQHMHQIKAANLGIKQTDVMRMAVQAWR